MAVAAIAGAAVGGGVVVAERIILHTVVVGILFVVEF